jgi:hypothetical protein
MVSLVASWEGACHINGCPFKWGSNIVLVHVAQIPGLGAATCCTDVTLLVPFLNIISCLEPVVLLLNLAQGFVNIQMTS